LDISIIISHIVSLTVSVRKEPSSGNKTKVKQHKTKAVTFMHILHGVKCQIVRVQTFLCTVVDTCAASWCAVSWKQAYVHDECQQSIRKSFVHFVGLVSWISYSRPQYGWRYPYRSAEYR